MIRSRPPVATSLNLACATCHEGAGKRDKMPSDFCLVGGPNRLGTFVPTARVARRLSFQKSRRRFETSSLLFSMGGGRPIKFSTGGVQNEKSNGLQLDLGDF